MATKQKNLPALTGLESLERFPSDPTIDELQERTDAMLWTTMTSTGKRQNCQIEKAISVLQLKNLNAFLDMNK